jgi:hypothetical protein
MAFGRVRLYHGTCMKGKVFTEEGDFLSHLKEGWVDFPTKIDPDTIPVTPFEVVGPPKIENRVALPPQAPARKPGRPSTKFKGGK